MREAESDRPLTTATATRPGQAVALEFADGRVAARITADSATDAAPPPPPPAAPKPRPAKRGGKLPDPRQGSMLDEL